MSNISIKAKAIEALDGMRDIVRAEMLVQGEYIEHEISNPSRIKSICGGHKHCAVGALWAGAKVRPKPNQYGRLIMPGVDNRGEFLRRRPGLRLAYDTLNEVAERFGEKHMLDYDSNFSSSIEGLFENNYNDGLTKRDLLTIIASAKRKIRAA